MFQTLRNTALNLMPAFILLQYLYSLPAEIGFKIFEQVHPPCLKCLGPDLFKKFRILVFWKGYDGTYAMYLASGRVWDGT